MTLESEYLNEPARTGEEENRYVPSIPAQARCGLDRPSRHGMAEVGGVPSHVNVGLWTSGSPATDPGANRALVKRDGRRRRRPKSWTRSGAEREART